MAMFTVASISARAGSKGVPGKNLRELGGRSLLERSIDLSLSVPLIDAVFISSDSPEMLEVGRRNGCHVYERPSYLADDHTSLHMLTKHNLTVIESELGKPDIIVQLSPTCPFLSSDILSEGITNVAFNHFTSAVTLTRIDHAHPYRARQITPDGSFVNYITHVDVESRCFHSRQDLPELWTTTGGVYIRNYDTLSTLTPDSFGFGTRPFPLCVTPIQAINIDSLMDLEFAEFISHKYKL